MSFAISGFGARQVQATPQLFQALSLAGSTPPARSEFGTPNNQLVPVHSAQGATPLFSLSLQAAPVAAAIEAVRNGSALQAPAVTSPAVGAAAPFSTAFTGAQNPNILVGSGPAGATLPTETPQVGGVPPEGLVALAPQNASQPNEADLISGLPPVTTQTNATNPVATNQPQATGTQAHSTVALASSSPSAIAKIVNTVKQLAVSAVYPQSLFTFTA